MSKQTSQNMKIREGIRDTLLNHWDPIGIKRIPEARDEYDSYISTIHNMLIMKKSEHEIAKYLWWLETEHMSLPGQREVTNKVAKRLVENSKNLI